MHDDQSKFTLLQFKKTYNNMTRAEIINNQTIHKSANSNCNLFKCNILKKKYVLYVLLSTHCANKSYFPVPPLPFKRRIGFWEVLFYSHTVKQL